MTAHIEVGKPLPINPGYAEDATARKFWRMSFRTDRQYARGQDALGQSVLVKHEREEDQSYARRLRVTKPRNYTGPILRLFNDYCFRKPPTRDGNLAQMAADLVADADGSGTSLDQFMRHSLLKAQVDRESYILCDTEGEAGDDMTVAQVQAAGVRPVLRRLPVESVIWSDVDDGVLEECIVLFCDDDQPYAISYTEETTQRITLTGDTKRPSDLVVAGMDDPVPHGYPGCPVVMLRPLFDILDDCGNGDSQAGPLAECQQSIFNQLSLLMEEQYNSCFTQFVAFGVAADQIGSTQMGSNRMVCLPNPGGKLEAIGASPDQSAIIRQNIIDEIANLYRAAGIISVQPDGQAESGVALGMRFNQLSANLSALSYAVQATEARLWYLIAGAWGFQMPTPTQYHIDYDQPNFDAELRTLIVGMSSAQMPEAFKREMAKRFAARNLKMDPAAVVEAADSITSAPPADAMGAFPRT
jgi:hypothetical protein